MILLLGGTSETRNIAMAIAESGEEVIVSTATDNDLDIGDHKNITRSIGRLDEGKMIILVRENHARALVDSTHPFATIVHETAKLAAEKAGIPCIRFEREETTYEYSHIYYAEGHESASQMAFSFGKPVLLTTGSRNLLPYVEKSKKTGIPIIARVLPHIDSVTACQNVGLAPKNVITGRGPFTVDQNLEAIEKFNIGVIVTKDSGAAGAVHEKITAAKMSNCNVVIVKRPGVSSAGAVDSVKGVMAELARNKTAHD